MFKGQVEIGYSDRSDFRSGVINLFDVESDELLFAFETRIFGRVRT